MYSSNLPKDQDGNIRKSTGRPPGSPNKLPTLAREKIDKVFEELGGVEGMANWVRASPRNMYAFYTSIYPKVMGTQPRLTFYQTKPVITRIENVFIDPQKRDGAVDATRMDDVFTVGPEPDRKRNPG